MTVSSVNERKGAARRKPSGPRGRREPQLRNVPRYAHTAGREAIELAATAGLVLDGWQGDFLTDSLGEDEDGNWSCFECGLIVSRQNGKGSVLEARVLAGMLLFGEKLILWSAHETKTAFEAFRRCEELFTSDPELKKLVKSIHRSNGNEGIELKNGARLRFVARTRGSGRGFSADLVILDEAYALTAEQMAALIPTLSSRPNPQIWYTSSPPLDGLTGDHLFNLRKRAKREDASLCWYDYGLQDVSLADLEEMAEAERSALLSSVDTYLATNPAAGIRIPLTFIERERATMPWLDFARERCGIWPKQVAEGAGVIDPEEWRARQVHTKPAGGTVFALDINPSRTMSALWAITAELEGPITLSCVTYAPGTDWVVPKLVQLRDTRAPLAIALDVKGPAGSLVLDLEDEGFHLPRDKDRPRRGDLYIPSAQEVAASFGLFVDLFRQGSIFHAGDDPLDRAVATAETRALVGGTAWDRGKGGADISPLCAVTIGVGAMVERRHLLAKYNLMESFA
ncbi:MAG TPA: hypothetical protein VFG99_07935 [Chloroflexia bacterium]|nr:hypothetical protein [Chloroflexia bacterium]